MSKSGLHRHYDRLTPEERFRLDVLAMARGDEQESERLVRSCPRATYTTNDRAFTVRWTAAENIALRISLPFLQECGRLRVVDAMRVLVPYQGTLNENLAFEAYYKGHEVGSYHAWNYAGQTGHPPAWPKGEDPSEIWEPDEDERDPAMERDEAELTTAVEVNSKFLPEILDRIERECVGRACSIWAGFEAFCDESLGVPAEKVAAVVLAPLVESIEAVKRRAESPRRRGGRRTRRGDARGPRGDMARYGEAGDMRRNLWGRLERLEAGARSLYNAVRLRDGTTTARYTTGEALEALGASIRREPNALLERFREADTTEGLPGLCLALEESRERAAREDTRG